MTDACCLVPLKDRHLVAEVDPQLFGACLFIRTCAQWLCQGHIISILLVGVGTQTGSHSWGGNREVKEA